VPAKLFPSRPKMWVAPPDGSQSTMRTLSLRSPSALARYVAEELFETPPLRLPTPNWLIYSNSSEPD
jgi:hypothetical protein